jgi:hypothetical protein
MDRVMLLKGKMIFLIRHFFDISAFFEDPPPRPPQFVLPPSPKISTLGTCMLADNTQWPPVYFLYSIWLNRQNQQYYYDSIIRHKSHFRISRLTEDRKAESRPDI